MPHVKVKRGKIYLDGDLCPSMKNTRHFCSGGFRHTAFTPDGKYVIKADFSPQHDPLYSQTQGEVALWKNEIRSVHRRYFPKLLDSGIHRYYQNLWWIIEEKLDLDPTTKPSNEAFNIVWGLQECYGIWDISVNTSSGGDYNWSLTRRGRIVVYDYGLNHCNRYAEDGEF